MPTDTKKILLFPGDGVGPEIAPWVHKTLEAVRGLGIDFDIKQADLGGASIDKIGIPIAPELVEEAAASDAVMMVSVGGPQWDNLPTKQRPEQAIFALRKKLDVFANLRPCRIFPQLKTICPLRPDIVERGVDILFIRELVSGAYFGQPKERREGPEGPEAVDTIYYNAREVERVARKAFEAAQRRNHHVTSVDKNNALETGRLWREVVIATHEDYPDVELAHQLVDSMAMKLITQPDAYDVVLTDNLQGDILTDEASVLSGSLGLMPSAALSDGTVYLYEPIHGSAPDIAGADKANPIGSILTVAMMLEYSFDQTEAARQIEQAVEATLDEGLRTPDIAAAGGRTCTTTEMGEAILKNLG